VLDLSTLGGLGTLVSMDRILGVWCTSSAVLFALADGGLVSAQPDRTDPIALLDDGEALEGMLESLRRVIVGTDVSRVRLLLGESGYPVRLQQAAPRITHETLVRLAAYRAGVPIEMLSRSDARARLGLPQAGDFEELLTDDVVGPPVGRFWSKGRKLAAAAALAND
jgi:hypothetical protein